MTYSDAPVPFIGGQAFPLEANTLCRFPSSPRPHMVHCILAVSHSRDRGIYDAIRGVYNAIGHVGCRPAPPFEEWGGIGQLCKHIFCRCACMSLKGDSCFVCFNHSSDRASAFVWERLVSSYHCFVAQAPPRCLWAVVDETVVDEAIFVLFQTTGGFASQHTTAPQQSHDTSPATPGSGV